MQLDGQEHAIGCILVAVDDPNKGLLASGNSNVVEEFDKDEQTGSEYGFGLRIVLFKRHGRWKMVFSSGYCSELIGLITCSLRSAATSSFVTVSSC